MADGLEQPADRLPGEKIYDVAWADADKRKPDPETGKLPPEGVPASIQERAYSSPIWYAPPAKNLTELNR